MQDSLGLKDVQHEVVSGVKSAVTGVVIVPLLVVHGDPHLRRIPVVQTVTTLEVLLAPEILGIVDVWVVVEAVPIAEISLSAPASTIGPLVGRSRVTQRDVAA